LLIIKAGLNGKGIVEVGASNDETISFMTEQFANYNFTTTEQPVHSTLQQV
jgi:hypothetical protein